MTLRRKALERLYRLPRCAYGLDVFMEDGLETDGEMQLDATLVHLDRVFPIGDKLLPGALDAWYAKQGDKPLPVLWGHLAFELIGDWGDLALDAKALKAKATLFDYVQRACEGYRLVQEKKLTGVSVGLTLDDFEFVERPKGSRKWPVYGFDIKAASIREASLVLWPQDRNARARVRRPRRQNSDPAMLRALIAHQAAERLGRTI